MKGLFLLVLLAVLCVLGSCSSSFGVYTFSYPKNNAKLDQQLDALQITNKKGKATAASSAGSSSSCKVKEEVDTFEVDLSGFDSMAELLPMLKRIYLDSETLAEKYRRLLVRKGVLVASLPHWFFGWKSYYLMAKLSHTEAEEEGEEPDEYIQVDLSSASNAFSLTIHFRVTKEGSIEMATKSSNTGAAGDVVDRIQSLIRSHTKKTLMNEMALHSSRRKFVKEESKVASKAKNEKKKVALDRIINPDKYKSSKSSTVRNPKKLGKSSDYARSESSRDRDASTRYKPSDAVQSRRVIKPRG